jgi:hypothetical protein
MTFIDPGGEVDEVLAAIRGCEVVLAEAMHGAIIADALRIPWIPVRCYDHILDFKWRDWCESLQLQYEPAVLDAKELSAPGWTTFLESTFRSARPVLSSEAVARTVTERLQERLELLRKDFGSSHHVRKPNDRTTPNHEWTDVRLLWEDIHEAGKGIDSVVSRKDPIIFVDDGQWTNQLSSGRTLLPFLERDGEYWGPPSDSDTAIKELERLRDTGARFIIFAQPSFWWLDFYAEFAAYLRSSYSLVLNDDRLVAFSLSTQTRPEYMTGTATHS